MHKAHYLLVSLACLVSTSLLSQDTTTIHVIPPPPPPPEMDFEFEEMEEATIYTKAEKMPIFPGCEDSGTNSDQANCTEVAIINHVMSNVIYPEEAREKGLQGRVFIEFVVNEKGIVEDIRILKGVVESIDKAAIAGVKTLPEFKPAIQRGKPVKLKYTLPVNFTLSNK